MDKTEKTLVILTPGFAKDESDTTCLPMQQQLIRKLKDSNPNLRIIILSFQYPYHTNAYKWHTIQVFPFTGQNKGGIRRLLLRKKIHVTLEKIHKATPITGLISFWYGECAAVGKQFAGKHQVKHFCWLLGQDVQKTNKYPKRIQLQSSELVALSEHQQIEFEKNHGIKPFHLIPPGINTEQFKNTVTERDIHILGVGSLIPLKRYDLFVEIVAGIKKQIPGVKAMLVGNGPERQRLQALIERFGLQSSLVLTGEISYEDVLEKMQRAKVLIHPSYSEGFSGVCLEALYAGAHVVSFCRSMYQEIRQWHIVGSKEDMHQKVLGILSDKELKHERVLFKSIEETAHDISTLFK